MPAHKSTALKVPGEELPVLSMRRAWRPLAGLQACQSQPVSRHHLQLPADDHFLLSFANVRSCVQRQQRQFLVLADTELSHRLRSK